MVLCCLPSFIVVQYVGDGLAQRGLAAADRVVDVEVAVALGDHGVDPTLDREVELGVVERAWGGCQVAEGLLVELDILEVHLSAADVAGWEGIAARTYMDSVL